MRFVLAALALSACAHGLTAEQEARLLRIEEACQAARAASEKNSEQLAKLTGTTPSVAHDEGTPPDAASARMRVLVGTSRTRGSAAAKVTIIAFSDFQCPFCSEANTTIAEIERTYGDDVRYVFKHNPLPFHENAFVAALAAESAARQNRFWPMHDGLFAHQRELSPASIAALAKELGLDLQRFQKDLQSAELKARVIADQEEAQTFDVSGTPTFFINGRKIVGALPFAEFKPILDEEIARADALLAQGVSRAALYERLLSD